MKHDPHSPHSVHSARSSVPTLITDDEKDAYKHNERRLDSDAESVGSRTSISDSMALVIRTTDLLATPITLKVMPLLSPMAFSSFSPYGENGVPRSFGLLASNSAGLSTPARSGTLPPTKQLTLPTVDSVRTDLPTEQYRLAPDSYGNEIPADAKWTKISRRLVSPEVLALRGRRYEA